MKILHNLLNSQDKISNYLQQVKNIVKNLVRKKSLFKIGKNFYLNIIIKLVQKSKYFKSMNFALSKKFKNWSIK